MEKYLKIENYLRFIRNSRDAAGKIKPVLQELEYLKLEMSRPKLQSLQNQFKGKRCFILGNGPSLRVGDLDRLKSEYTFASNKIFLIFNETSWRPTFYSVEDHLVLEQNQDEIESVEAEYKIFPSYPIQRARSFSNSIYFRLHYQDFYPNEPEFSDNLMKTLYWGSSIVYTQMQLAVAMGFSQIYLIGVDYSYVEPSQKNGKVLTSEGEVNHFHKDYRKPGEKWFVPNLHYHEKSFGKAKKFADSAGIEIINATRGGKLEIFPRLDLDSLI